jgi:hypothetical protein
VKIDPTRLAPWWPRGPGAEKPKSRLQLAREEEQSLPKQKKIKIKRDPLPHELEFAALRAAKRKDKRRVPGSTRQLAKRWIREQHALDPRCRECGVETELPPSGNANCLPHTATVDHIIPVCRGGENHPSNYQLFCFKCNQLKGPGDRSNDKPEIIE